MHRTHKHIHFFLISHLPSYLKQRSLVAPPTPRPPSPNEKAITPSSLPQIPAAWRRSFVRWGVKKKRKTKNPTHTHTHTLCLSTCLQLGICFSLRFASLPSNLFSPSPWLQTPSPSLSFSILSAASLVRSSHLGALGCSGFRRITLTMVDQYKY